MSYSQQSNIFYEFLNTFLLIVFLLDVWSRFLIDGACFRLLFVWEVDFHRVQNQRLPNDRHRKDDDVSKEIKLFVDAPPFTEAKVDERYKAVAGDEPRVELTDEENCGLHCEGFVGFLELGIVIESWCYLWKV